MNVDCEWISSKLESFFCDALNAEEDRLARTHIENCAKCREEIQAFNAIDPLIKQYFQHQFAIALAPKRRSPGMIYGTAIAAAFAAVVLLAVLLRSPQTNAPVPTVSSQPEIAAAPVPGAVPPVDKNTDAGEIERSKPQRPSPPGRGPRTESARGVGIAPDAPEFLVSDPAGYSHTLADFRGSILILGIWSSDESDAIANLERIYRTFSPNTKLRVLGVSNERDVKPPRTTFPLAYNQGSRLLNADPGDILLIDQTGSVRYRGSLSGDYDQLVKTLRTALEPLGIR